jgi:pSer/pThr/pTyr-binding forkhead associated (FHA) protein
VVAIPTQILEIQTGKYKGRRVKLTDPEVIIGRGEEARIRVASAEVSRQHCVLIRREDGVLVRDNGSRNGTFVDGRPITGERLLVPGSTLTVGPLTFLLLGDRPAGKPSPPEVAVGSRSLVDQGLSDEDIASWLSDVDLNSPSSLSDTTIVEETSQETPLSIPTSPSAESAPRRRDFKTLAEEAQDIIRRHFEMQDRKRSGA